MGVQFKEQKLYTQKVQKASYTSLIQTNDFLIYEKMAAHLLHV
ncbi:hypothetical protein [Bacillus sp. UNC41MFS5]|nr:hypothetical protein [Bacillus sp. UNC41MFS5]